MTTLRPISFSGIVGLGDAGDNLPHFGPYINFHAQQLVGALHFLGDFHLANPKLDFQEVVNADLVAAAGAAGCSGSALVG